MILKSYISKSHLTHYSFYDMIKIQSQYKNEEEGLQKGLQNE